MKLSIFTLSISLFSSLINAQAHAYHVSCQLTEGIQITMLGDSSQAKELGQGLPISNIQDVNDFKMPARLFIVSDRNGDRLAVDGKLISKNSSRIISFKELKEHKIGIDMIYRSQDNSFETKLSIGPLPTTVGNIKCLIDYNYSPPVS